ncbi:alpha/beta hydrolase [Patescibacteria group bacterium AH-259-L07]|nr:alpha/beta hydrolase [Patescibacteria group bacterium AH-259-L07]
MEKKVSIINKFGEKLIGLKAIPPKLNEKNPAMVFVHGFAYYKEEDGLFDDFAKRLSDLGIIVYRFDFSGCGESEGDFSKSSLTKLRDELQSIIDFVKSDPKVDTNKIGILSQSFGTSTTIALHPEAKCMVMLGTLAHPKERLSKHFGEGYKPESLSVRKRSNGTIIKVESLFWKDLDSYNILNLIKEIKCPILFAHGEKDNIVPLSDMELVFENANEPKQKIIIENADHGMIPSRGKLYNIVVEWLSKKLP